MIMENEIYNLMRKEMRSGVLIIYEFVNLTINHNKN
jgi:hypothetical protein